MGSWGLRDPLILTLRFDPALQARLDAMRAKWFPPERNYLDAHLTLFHALPGERLGPIVGDLSSVASATSPAPATVTGVFPFGGGGFAYNVDVPGLTTLHRRLQTLWRPWLTRQDARALRPHVTIQNKVKKDVAQAALAQVRSGFAPFGGRAEGLALWHYRGGPWSHVSDIPFSR